MAPFTSAFLSLNLTERMRHTAASSFRFTFVTRFCGHVRSRRNAYKCKYRYRYMHKWVLHLQDQFLEQNVRQRDGSYLQFLCM
jgi:hypothetical protein